MIIAIVSTILAVFMFTQAKAKRDSTGEVKTIQTYVFLFCALLAVGSIIRYLIS